MFSKIIESPLGPLIAIASGHALYHLEFLDCYEGKEVPSGSNGPLESIARELALYFEGKLREFMTPLLLEGSDFHKKVMQKLQKVPFGLTCSYQALAKEIGQEKAFRAVAKANSRNKIAIVLPCHRVVYKGGGIGGYNGGIYRKKWLLDHEQKGKEW